MVMMITPMIDAIIDDVGTVQLSKDASNRLMEISTNHENQLIDLFSLKNENFDHPNGNNFTDSVNYGADVAFTSKDMNYSKIDYPRYSTEKYKNANGLPNTYFPAIGPKWKRLYEITEMNNQSSQNALIADSNVSLDIKTNLEFLNRRENDISTGPSPISLNPMHENADYGIIISNLNYLSNQHSSNQYLSEQILIADSDIQNDNSRSSYGYSKTKKYDEFARRTLIADSDIDNHSIKANYIYESDEPNYPMNRIGSYTSDSKEMSQMEKYSYNQKDDPYGYILDTAQIASSNILNGDLGTYQEYESNEPNDYLLATTRIASSDIVFGKDQEQSGEQHSDQGSISGLDQPSIVESNLDRLNIMPKTDRRSVFQNTVGTNQDAVLKNFDIIEGEKPQRSDQMLDYKNIDNRSLSGKKKYKKDFAIVIGIDNYKDRMDLHSSVNDAKTFAGLLEMYGYDVLMLTDDSHYKPTKHNILEVALAEVKQRQNRGGNIIVYYSGHGVLDRDGDYYLIPQDADGVESTYISEDDLNTYIQGVKNLAIIIDACHSGALCNATGESQLMLTSSRANEPSNEEWTGSLSVFTHKLCEAIAENGQKKKKILLQSCFYEAYNETTQWASGHMLSQTPVLKDLTPDKAYYIK
ncbi:MAG: caspase family protein [Methanothrix sp.]|nr:MAG: caspase family protein [Methanothrix sp.]